MNDVLEKLTKEELIRVIANLSDGTNWHDGYGFTYNDAHKLNQISALCLEYCVETNNWEIPEV
jgi:hypothetical protein